MRSFLNRARSAASEAIEHSRSRQKHSTTSGVHVSSVQHFVRALPLPTFFTTEKSTIKVSSVFAEYRLKYFYYSLGKSKKILFDSFEVIRCAELDFHFSL